MSLSSLPEIVANFGPISVRAVYRKTDDSGAEGPAICLYEGRYKEGGNEFLRIDLFKKDPHYHINPEPNNPLASSVSVPDKNASELLDYLICKKTLASLARTAGEIKIGAYLDNNGEVKNTVDALVYNMVKFVSEPGLRSE